MIEYLLGELSEAEQLRLENQYVSDDDCFDRLLATQDTLIDDYVRNRLSGSDREKFEKYFLITPARREKVEFARALRQVMAEKRDVVEAEIAKEQAVTAAQPEPRKRIFSWQSLLRFILSPRPAFSFALVLLLAGSWLFVQNFGLRAHLEQIERERLTLQQQVTHQREQSQQLQEQLQREMNQRAALEQELAKSSHAQPVMLSFVLTPGLLRGTEAEKRLVIPPGATQVQLQLDLETEAEYKSYRAILRTVSGDEVWSQGMLKARPSDVGKAIFLILPATVLAEDDYILKLSGLNPAGGFDELSSYPFSVRKR